MQNVTFMSPSPYNKQSGFTLIELMISLVLGLLISAAVVQIYITNAHTSTVQKGASELQDASVFGIQLLESHIRLANMGNDTIQIDDELSNGGIVLTDKNLSTNAAYWSHSPNDSPNSNKDIGWSGVSNMTDAPSDQLTIQFSNITGHPMPDCEGTDIANGETVVERYFLRPASTGTGLVLACDAGRVEKSTATVIAGPVLFGEKGQAFIQGVDQFKFLLGVQDDSNQLQYVTSAEYRKLATPKPSIVSVKLALVVRGSTPVFGTETQDTFYIFGQEQKVTPAEPGDKKKQVRALYESTTLLRNARVVS